MAKRIGLFLLIAVLLGAGVIAYAFAEARRSPVVRRLTLPLSDWPAGQRPVRVVLASDVHLGGGPMDAARLGRIVAAIDALRPDLILIAGDFVFGEEPGGAGRVEQPLGEALARLRAPLGTVAVLGNHDWSSGPQHVRAALRRAGVALLENDAVERGPLAIAGVGDRFSHHDDAAQALRRLRPLPGARLILTHSPMLAPLLPGGDAPVLAGHTHCGQVVLPIIGAPHPVARVPYLCGLYRRGGRPILVTAGLGTSDLPLRLGAPPDLWLLTLGPRSAGR